MARFTLKVDVRMLIDEGEDVLQHNAFCFKIADFIRVWAKRKLDVELVMGMVGGFQFQGGLDNLYYNLNGEPGGSDLWVVIDARGDKYLANYEFWDWNKLIYVYGNLAQLGGISYQITHELLHAILCKLGYPPYVYYGSVHLNETNKLIEKYDVSEIEWLALGGNYD